MSERGIGHIAFYLNNVTIMRRNDGHLGKKEKPFKEKAYIISVIINCNFVLLVSLKMLRVTWEMIQLIWQWNIGVLDTVFIYRFW